MASLLPPLLVHSAQARTIANSSKRTFHCACILQVGKGASRDRESVVSRFFQSGGGGSQGAGYRNLDHHRIVRIVVGHFQLTVVVVHRKGPRSNGQTLFCLQV